MKDPANANAWKQFVDRYTPLVYGFCRRQGLQSADAHDVTQNVFLAVSRAMPNFNYDPQRGQFRGWLGRVTYHEISRYRRRQARLSAVYNQLNACPPDEVEHEVAAQWEIEFNAHLYRMALETVRDDLPSDVWHAFEATWIENQKPQEVARRMHKPPQWIYKARFRVLQRLKETLASLAEDAVPLARVPR